MEIKEVKVKIPEGYEVDKKKSSFEEPINIVFKKIEPEIKTWEDLVGKQIPDGSKFIDTFGYIMKVNGEFGVLEKNDFIDEKHAKSALAMAQISQLMPYYGGEVTDEEWDDRNVRKYFIAKFNNNITRGLCVYDSCCHLLAFHTEEQRDSFLKNNEELVKDYLMIDNK